MPKFAPPNLQASHKESSFINTSSFLSDILNSNIDTIIGFLESFNPHNNDNNLFSDARKEINVINWIEFWALFLSKTPPNPPPEMLKSLENLLLSVKNSGICRKLDFSFLPISENSSRRSAIYGPLMMLFYFNKVNYLEDSMMDLFSAENSNSHFLDTFTKKIPHHPKFNYYNNLILLIDYLIFSNPEFFKNDKKLISEISLDESFLFSAAHKNIFSLIDKIFVFNDLTLQKTILTERVYDIKHLRIRDSIVSLPLFTQRKNCDFLNIFFDYFLCETFDIDKVFEYLKFFSELSYPHIALFALNQLIALVSDFLHKNSFNFPKDVSSYIVSLEKARKLFETEKDEDTCEVIDLILICIDPSFLISKTSLVALYEYPDTNLKNRIKQSIQSRLAIDFSTVYLEILFSEWKNKDFATSLEKEKNFLQATSSFLIDFLCEHSISAPDTIIDCWCAYFGFDKNLFLEWPNFEIFISRLDLDRYTNSDFFNELREVSAFQGPNFEKKVLKIRTCSKYFIQHGESPLNIVALISQYYVAKSELTKSFLIEIFFGFLKSTIETNTAPDSSDLYILIESFIVYLIKARISFSEEQKILVANFNGYLGAYLTNDPKYLLNASRKVYSHVALETALNFGVFNSSTFLAVIHLNPYNASQQLLDKVARFSFSDNLNVSVFKFPGTAKNLAFTRSPLDISKYALNPLFETVNDHLCCLNTFIKLRSSAIYEKFSIFDNFQKIGEFVASIFKNDVWMHAVNYGHCTGAFAAELKPISSNFVENIPKNLTRYEARIVFNYVHIMNAEVSIIDYERYCVDIVLKSGMWQHLAKFISKETIMLASNNKLVPFVDSYVSLTPISQMSETFKKLGAFYLLSQNIDTSLYLSNLHVSEVQIDDFEWFEIPSKDSKINETIYQKAKKYVYEAFGTRMRNANSSFFKNSLSLKIEAESFEFNRFEPINDRIISELARYPPLRANAKFMQKMSEIQSTSINETTSLILAGLKLERYEIFSMTLNEAVSLISLCNDPKILRFVLKRIDDYFTMNPNSLVLSERQSVQVLTFSEFLIFIEALKKFVTLSPIIDFFKVCYTHRTTLFSFNFLSKENLPEKLANRAALNLTALFGILDDKLAQELKIETDLYFFGVFFVFTFATLKQVPKYSIKTDRKGKIVGRSVFLAAFNHFLLPFEAFAQKVISASPERFFASFLPSVFAFEHKKNNYMAFLQNSRCVAGNLSFFVKDSVIIIDTLAEVQFSITLHSSHVNLIFGEITNSASQKTLKASSSAETLSKRLLTMLQGCPYIPSMHFMKRPFLNLPKIGTYEIVNVFESKCNPFLVKLNEGDSSHIMHMKMESFIPGDFVHNLLVYHSMKELDIKCDVHLSYPFSLFALFSENLENRETLANFYKKRSNNHIARKSNNERYGTNEYRLFYNAFVANLELSPPISSFYESLAVNTSVEYIINAGDRHSGNFMLDSQSIIGIDFGMAYGSSAKLPVPETIRFNASPALMALNGSFHFFIEFIEICRKIFEIAKKDDFFDALKAAYSDDITVDELLLRDTREDLLKDMYQGWKT